MCSGCYSIAHRNQALHNLRAQYQGMTKAAAVSKTKKTTGTASGRRKLVDIRKDNSEQILRVAEQVFSERGFKGTTISAIADAAELPKANILYYFKSKEGLYKAVLVDLLQGWMHHMDDMTADQHPREALRNYIVSKIRQSKEHPNASRIFAAEVLHGAPFLREQLEGPLKEQFERTCGVIRSWVAKRWMDPVSPEHLMFMLWSSTQSYADFEVQSSILLSRDALEEADYNEGVELITRVVLKGCGVSLV